jgi:hypothetical protein
MIIALHSHIAPIYFSIYFELFSSYFSNKHFILYYTILYHFKYLVKSGREKGFVGME